MDEQMAGTTWQGVRCSRGVRQLLDATYEKATEEMLAKFGIEGKALSVVVEEQQRRNLERQRAMYLCHVDEIEQALGYGNEPGRPRTSEIRQYWKDSGRPRL